MYRFPARSLALFNGSMVARILFWGALALGPAAVQTQSQVALTFTAVNVPGATYTEANAIGGVNGLT
ncbi:MAG: hypothetical protein WAL76_01755, partial [Candidatus Sulfotelmatobacter sp.]